MDSIIGKTIDNYKIVEVLGRGGMGVVYKAKHVTLNQDRALKLMDSMMAQDSELLERFEIEAKAMGKLNHPNIVAVYDYRNTAYGFCIVMEYIVGRTLAQVIHEQGRLPINETLTIIMQFLEAMRFAHAAQVVHRDIKPSNIMLTPNNVVKVLDFGLAKLKETTGLTKTGRTAGTLGYMSPEQVRGLKVDKRSDIWSIGVVLYEMLCCRLPFPTEHEAAFLYAVVHEEPIPLNDNIPSELRGVVNRCLIKDTTKRYQQTEDILKDLLGLQASFDITRTIFVDPPKDSVLKRFSNLVSQQKKIIVLAISGGILVLVVVLIVNYSFNLPWTQSPKGISDTNRGLRADPETSKFKKLDLPPSNDTSSSGGNKKIVGPVISPDGWVLNAVGETYSRFREDHPAKTIARVKAYNQVLMLNKILIDSTWLTSQINVYDSFEKLVEANQAFQKLLQATRPGFITSVRNIRSETLNSSTDTKTPRFLYRITLDGNVAQSKGMPDPGFVISLALNKKGFVSGENLVATISCSRDAYITVFNIHILGIDVLYPNRAEKENFLKSGVTLSLGSGKITYPVAFSGGTEGTEEIILAVATREKNKINLEIGESKRLTLSVGNWRLDDIMALLKKRAQISQALYTEAYQLIEISKKQ